MLVLCDFTVVSHPRVYVAQLLILVTFCNKPHGLGKLVKFEGAQLFYLKSLKNTR